MCQSGSSANNIKSFYYKSRTASFANKHHFRDNFAIYHKAIESDKLIMHFCFYQAWLQERNIKRYVVSVTKVLLIFIFFIIARTAHKNNKFR